MPTHRTTENKVLYEDQIINHRYHHQITNYFEI